MQIDFRRAGLQIALEGGVLAAHVFPVEADRRIAVGVEAGVALGVPQRLDKRAEAGLRGQAGNRVHRGIDRVNAGDDRGEHGAPEMPEVSCVWRCIGRPISSFSVLTSTRAAAGLQQAGHVLDAEDMAAGGLELLGEVDVIVERVFGAVGIENVAGVADRAFDELAGLRARRRWRRACSRPS